MNGLDPVAAWEVKRVITALCASGRHADIVSTQVLEARRELLNEHSGEPLAAPPSSRNYPPARAVDATTGR
ncbi:hypothetical protein P9273_28915 [Mesorhizobium sp. WSM4935]|uniref:hypothetical protein n=1 Tax=Mesorhizobium sp. WSM4935 TaxID=3038547 RepID=UPI0024154EE7|nr:hypothetical protein [Mesorhizobium sp. WSM4935]MDG4879103.1 hypothetical protein [Mesorhizobium sp. WSM4935]